MMGSTSILNWATRVANMKSHPYLLAEAPDA